MNVISNLSHGCTAVVVIIIIIVVIVGIVVVVLGRNRGVVESSAI